MDSELRTDMLEEPYHALTVREIHTDLSESLPGGEPS
jgi:hypothetical protein